MVEPRKKKSPAEIFSVFVKTMLRMQKSSIYGFAISNFYEPSTIARALSPSGIVSKRLSTAMVCEFDIWASEERARWNKMVTNKNKYARELAKSRKQDNE